jgi:hypothetical protein
LSDNRTDGRRRNRRSLTTHAVFCKWTAADWRTGKGYDVGRGEEARANGDGWSIRLQFDSRPDVITNTL